MNVQKAILPGLLAGISSLIAITSLLAATSVPVVAEAAANMPAANMPAAGEPLQSAEVIAANAASNTENLSACLISASYPESIRQWCEIIERHADANGLDPNLVSAVMLQESAGQPDAYSKSGAVGLLQVMPRDGKSASFMCINGPCFADRPSTDELFDPEFNVAYGTKMLSGLIQRYGNVRDALKSYGPKDVGYYYADIVLGIFTSNQ